MNAVAKKSKSSQPKEAGEEMSGPQFSTEVWLTIFGFLDWENLQEKAVLVCNSWLEMIRGSPKLSGEMALKSDKIKKDDLIAILTRWKELKVLRAIQGNDFDFKGIKFSNYENLTQIIVSKQLYGENFKEFPTKSPKWFFSTIVCLDPQVTPKLVNSLQSLKKSKISPDSVKELALSFFGYDLALNLDEEGMFISNIFFKNLFGNHSDIINGYFKFQVCTLMIGLSNSLDHN